MTFISRASTQYDSTNHRLSPISANNIIDLVKFLTSFDILAKVRRWCEYHQYLELLDDVAHSFVPNPANINKKKNSLLEQLKKKMPKKKVLRRVAKRIVTDQEASTRVKFGLGSGDDEDNYHYIEVDEEDSEDENGQFNNSNSMKGLSPQQLAKIKNVIQQSAKLILGPAHVNEMTSEDEDVKSAAEAAISLQQVEHQELNVLISPLSALGGVILKYCEKYPKAEQNWITHFQTKGVTSKKLDAATLAKRMREALEGDVIEVKFTDPEEVMKKRNPGVFAAESLLTKAVRRSASPDFGRYQQQQKENNDNENTTNNNNNNENMNNVLTPSVYEAPPALVSILTPLPSQATVKPTSSKNIKNNNNNSKQESSSSTNATFLVYSEEEKHLLKTATTQLVPILFQLIDVKSLGVISLEQLTDFCAGIILSTENANLLQVDTMPSWRLKGAKFTAFAVRQSKLVPDLLMQEKVLSFIGIPENVSTSAMASVVCVPERLVAPVPNNSLRRDFEDSILEKKMRLILMSQKQQQIERKNKQLNIQTFHRKGKQSAKKILESLTQGSGDGDDGGTASIQQAKEILQNDMNPSKTCVAIRVFGEEMTERKDFNGFIGVDIVLLLDLGLYACSNTVGEIIIFTADAARPSVVATTPRSPSSITALATCRGLFRNSNQKQLLIACDRVGRVMFYEVNRISVRETKVISHRVETFHHPVRFAWVHDKNYTLILVAGENQVILMDLRKLVHNIENRHSNHQSNFANNIVIGSFPSRAVITTASLSIPLNALFACGAFDGPELIPLICVAGTMSASPTPLIAADIHQQSTKQNQEPTASKKTSTTAVGILNDLIASQKKSILSCVCDPQIPQGLSVDAKLTVTVWDLRRMTPTQCVVVNVPGIFFQPKMFSMAMAKGKRRCALLTDGAHALWFERPSDQRTLTVTFGNESFEVLGDEADSAKKEREDANDDDNGNSNNNNNDDDLDMFDDDAAIARESDAAAPVVSMFEYNKMILVVTERTVSLWRSKMEPKTSLDGNDEEGKEGKDKKNEEDNDDSDNESKSPSQEQTTNAVIPAHEELEVNNNDNTKSTLFKAKPLPNFNLEIDRDLDNSCRRLYLVKRRTAASSSSSADEMQDSWIMISRGTLPTGLTVSCAAFNSQRQVVVKKSSQSPSYPCSGRAHLLLGLTNGDLLFVHPVSAVIFHTFQNVFDPHNLSMPHDSWNLIVPRFVSVEERELEMEKARTEKLLAMQNNNENSNNNDDQAGKINQEQQNKSIQPNENASSLQTNPISSICFIGEHDVAVCEQNTGNVVLMKDYFMPQTGSRWNVRRVGTMMSACASGGNGRQDQLPHASKLIKALFSTSSAKKTLDIALFSTKGAYFWPLTLISLDKKILGVDEKTLRDLNHHQYRNHQLEAAKNDTGMSSEENSIISKKARRLRSQSLFASAPQVVAKNVVLDVPPSKNSNNTNSGRRTSAESTSSRVQGEDEVDDDESHPVFEKMIAFLTNPLLVVLPQTSEREDRERDELAQRQRQEEERLRKKALELAQSASEGVNQVNNIIMSSSSANTRRSSAISEPFFQKKNVLDESGKTLANYDRGEDDDDDDDDDTATTTISSQGYSKPKRRAVLVLSRKVVVLDFPKVSARNAGNNEHDMKTKIDQEQSTGDHMTATAEDTLVASFDTCLPWRRFDDPPTNTVAILEEIKNPGDTNNPNNSKIILFLGRSDGSLSVYDLTSFFVTVMPVTTNQENPQQQQQQQQRVITLLSRYRITRRSLNFILYSSQRNRLVVMDDAKVVTTIPIEKLLSPPLDIATCINVQFQDFTYLRQRKANSAKSTFTKNNFCRPRLFSLSGDISVMNDSKNIDDGVQKNNNKQGDNKSEENSHVRIEEEAKPDYSAFDHQIPGSGKNKGKNKVTNSSDEDDDDEQILLTSPEPKLPPPMSTANSLPALVNSQQPNQRRRSASVVDFVDNQQQDKPALGTTPLKSSQMQRALSIGSNTSKNDVRVASGVNSESKSRRKSLPGVLASSSPIQQVRLPKLVGPSLARNFSKTPIIPDKNEITDNNQHHDQDYDSSLFIQQNRQNYSKTPQIMKSAFLWLSENTATNNKNGTMLSKADILNLNSPLANNNNNSNKNAFNAIQASTKRSISPTSKRLLTELFASSPEAAEKTTAAAFSQVSRFLRDAEQNSTWLSPDQKDEKIGNGSQNAFAQHRRRPSTPIINTDPDKVDVDKRFVEPVGGKIMKKPLVSETLLSIYKRKPL